MSYLTGVTAVENSAYPAISRPRAGHGERLIPEVARIANAKTAPEPFRRLAEINPRSRPGCQCIMGVLDRVGQIQNILPINLNVLRPVAHADIHRLGQRLCRVDRDSAIHAVGRVVRAPPEHLRADLRSTGPLELIERASPRRRRDVRGESGSSAQSIGQATMRVPCSPRGGRGSLNLDRGLHHPV